MKRKDFKTLLFVFIAWRVVLFLVGLIAQNILSYDPSFPYSNEILAATELPQWLYSWANFDGVHYLTIAQKGYVGTGLIQAFFPLFPLILSLFSSVSAQLVSGLIISNFVFFVCLVVWFYFLSQTKNIKTAWWGVSILLLFPTSFFFGALYTESIFLILVLLSFLSARKRKWWLAGVLAALASATRVVGVLLLPALLLERFLQEREKVNNRKAGNIREVVSFEWSVFKKLLRVKNWPSLFWILTSSLGLLSFMFYLHREFDDGFYFLHVQEEFGAGRQESIVLFPQVIWRYIKILLTYRPIDLKYFAFVQEFLVSVLGLLGLLWSFKSVRWSYVVFSLLAFLLPTLTGTFSSMPRYVLVCPALFILFAEKLSSSSKLKFAWLGFSAVLLILNVILFAQGYWVA